MQCTADRSRSGTASTSTPSAFDLEDTYLPAFRATITEAKADSIMCAYNAIYGFPACASPLLLKQKLRGAWKFQGFVTSDCGAIGDFYSTEKQGFSGTAGHHFSPDAAHASATAVLAGTDTSCGDEYDALPQAVKEGLLPESALDIAVKRLFTARIRLGLFDPPAQVAYARLRFDMWIRRSIAHLHARWRRSRWCCSRTTRHAAVAGM